MFIDYKNSFTSAQSSVLFSFKRLPYEALKTLTRGKSNISKSDIHQFIDGLKITAKLKKELKAISPHNYIGVGFEY